jgi:hypothetical protein
MSKACNCFYGEIPCFDDEGNDAWTVCPVCKGEAAKDYPFYLFDPLDPKIVIGVPYKKGDARENGHDRT